MSNDLLLCNVGRSAVVQQSVLSGCQSYRDEGDELHVYHHR